MLIHPYPSHLAPWHFILPHRCHRSKEHHHHQAVTQGQHWGIHVSQQRISHTSKGPKDQQLQPAEEDTCLDRFFGTKQHGTPRKRILLVNWEEDVPNFEIIYHFSGPRSVSGWKTLYPPFQNNMPSANTFKFCVHTWSHTQFGWKWPVKINYSMVKNAKNDVWVWSSDPCRPGMEGEPTMSRTSTQANQARKISNGSINFQWTWRHLQSGR